MEQTREMAKLDERSDVLRAFLLRRNLLQQRSPEGRDCSELMKQRTRSRDDGEKEALPSRQVELSRNSPQRACDPSEGDVAVTADRMESRDDPKSTENDRAHLRNASAHPETMHLVATSSDPAYRAECLVCKWKFTRSWHAIDHVLRVHFNRHLFKCEKCGRRYKQKASLKKHQLSQHGSCG
uniref:C2H2-type domain-containing protein n=1 Tax=Erythrolobus madagascarensis TaxID=708628 RepID=A0A7S0XK28_9RHOD|mmetsp:Transcript_558/g.1085  ORF Transcript_558/g.1085 Transcript_558/m.1085 type:complete len:182 (+) Transcript_558:289-834(+)|eukprot:CAMPEP_0185848522 /NCGR_PEP_ID=MMETSP1354-20130828/3368_1 /TAXON_ID=708628 /ORGANISM="Erythrolobus madagascarensis, Strain CCMP3276" /LENGTH=181 /DNA_ID=CAMNT_0028548927 /DNA_START=154 /DNA_END=699 /DNA_ORIENTATION=+